MKIINWGIIGCGDVTEIKSGPAFNKVPHSKLVAVMRRDAEKARDYALRHNVPKWYSDANQLINDPEVNAIYVATPPLSHEAYTISALKAGKPVYVEKPMSTSATGCINMLKTANECGVKLCVAHYRRAQPMFKKIKQLIEENAIGDIRFVEIDLLQSSLTPDELMEPRKQWRVDPAIAGGGLFHDLSPHQLDLMIYFFGKITKASGFSLNQAGLYAADDMVSGNILFDSGVIVRGLWCFSVPADQVRESCTMYGALGTLSFSVFGETVIRITRNGGSDVQQFEKLPHVQQPMIAEVVDYFTDLAPNPCPAEEALEVMKVIDNFTNHEK
jgi:predicted dehydrogenase